MPDQPILLARQPIYDASLNVVAFELLYRAISPDSAEIRNGDEASSRVLLSAFGGAGIMDITDGKPAYINFTKHLIINPPPVDPQHLVIEVLEDVLVTPELLDSVRRLRAQGYRIALDDFQHHPSLEPLVELADIVKLDVLELGEVKLRAEVRQLRNYPVRLLAEKIESWEMYNQCVDLGFSFFQGFFLARPQLLRGRRSAPARPAIAALMAQLADPDIGIAELTTTVSADPVLSFNLIRLVNSPLYRRAQPIESVREAIFALGVERVRGWCYLVALAGIGGKPSELTRIAMRRARFCELLGEIATGAVPGRCFTAGILSTLDAFMDAELGELLASLALSGEMHAALLAREGCMGVVLDTALAFETGSWARVPWSILAAHGIDQLAAERAYLDSLHWVSETLGAIDAGSVFS
ncbi:MAG: HDOD domain-containing protein [Pseudomonadales bacterium]|jgi:EAL and modified HD-GYP domain-containing signal transduction protein|nr:HDOD domain-containing protein [Pseudomonadales bacterium]MBP7911870.1 HDOD domain-containing protein [Pseudomonadales bacterium]